MGQDEYKIWLEFEEWKQEESDDPEDDFFNMLIQLPCGKKYALNVWTFRYLERARQEDQERGECLNGSYLIPPDLLVERPDRQHIERIVNDLIKGSRLKPEWLVVEES